ncbi:hypothetical protein ACT8ZV_09650 [Nocardioides sp. MAHUQ-72]|uniref:hypothetical protein n=1 Tax=unclassified Nocardioides TaxID=2615069 RepID=UPI00361202AD
MALLVGAWVAWGTGEELRSGRTHMDSVIVLAFLGLVLLGNAVAVIAYGRRVVRARDRALWRASSAQGRPSSS